MIQRRSIVLVLACFVVAFFVCYYPVLFQDQQFGFRDAAHFYYPLYERVQQEWEAGRIPLWEIEENAGMPILGNPTAAVLYPLKVCYSILPYAWGTRVYALVHTALAFGAMLILMRSWGTTWTGSGLSAMGYAFGAPILFQSCNIIFLVGAAWLPLGVHAVDQWVRAGRRWAILELAVVLAMQTLGGEPQSAYLLGLAAGGYAAGLSWHRAAARRRALESEKVTSPSRLRGFAGALIFLAYVAIWIAGTLVLGSIAPRFRAHKPPPPEALPWMRYVPITVAGLWAAAGLGFLVYWVASYRPRRGWRMPLGMAWLGLGAAAALACALSAAQLLPVLEFTQQSLRAAESSPHDIYPFSIEPIRLAGLVWPDVLGVTFGVDTYWGDLLRIPGTPARIWVPSLYLGGLTVVLAAGVFGLRRGAPWRVWLSVIVVISVLGSLGQYTSPIWATRALAAGTKAPVLQSVIDHLGPLDPEDTPALRQDWFLRDGDGSIYWWFATFVPGFRQFRYPAKLFTFTTLALAALGGIGWDSLRNGTSRRPAALCAAFLALTVAAVVGVLLRHDAILAAFRAGKFTSIYGPFDPEGGYRSVVRGLVHAIIVLAAGLTAIRLVVRRPQLASALVLCVSTADILVANAKYVLTIPQSTLEGIPEVLQVIRDAEKARPMPGPYRVHRLPSWEPVIWQATRSPNRSSEIVAWERDTLQPKYGIPFGLEYAHVMGTAELYEYEWYYGGFYRAVYDPDFTRMINIKPGDKVVYYPRRTFDMWNVRYFIVPLWPNGWRDAFRSYASMLLESEVIYPGKQIIELKEKADVAKDWAEKRDIQVYRNLREHPRAWVVHSLRKLPPLEEMRPGAERQSTMQEICYANDLIWNNPDRQVFDYRTWGWVDPPEYDALSHVVSGGGSRASEAVKIDYPSPQRVELDVTLETPGVVVLADVYYPGWKLTIDGKPAPIYRINRVMRGAAAGKGPHHLVFTYEPGSFRTGLVVSFMGLACLVLLGLAFTFRPVEPSLIDDAGVPSHDNPQDVCPDQCPVARDRHAGPWTDRAPAEGRTGPGRT